MSRYTITWAGVAESQFDDLLARATSAGKRDEFVQRFAEIGQSLTDPARACQVGRSVGQTQLPGGFYREWQYHFLFIRYVIFPDEECGWIYQIEFNPPSWA